MKRSRSADWDMVGWPYKALHASVIPWHNRWLLRVRGAEHIPKDAGALLASNHACVWDPIILCCCSARPIRWLGKKEVYVGPGKWFFPSVGVIPVDRSRKNPEAFAAARDALKQGALVGIFPEGTIHPGEGVGPARPGAAKLALETGAPVIPLGLASDRFWPRGRKVPRVSQRIFVSIGEPFHVKGDDITSATAQIMDAIARELAVAKAARDAPTAEWRAP